MRGNWCNDFVALALPVTSLCWNIHWTWFYFNHQQTTTEGRYNVSQLESSGVTACTVLVYKQENYKRNLFAILDLGWSEFSSWRRGKKKGKDRRFIYCPIVRTSPLKRSAMDHTGFTVQNTPCLPLPRSVHQAALPPTSSINHLIAAYYSFIKPERMKGWVSLVSWPTADGLPIWLPISCMSGVEW